MIGIDSDEIEFLLSVMADKIQAMKDARIPLSSVALGLQGLTFLNDPISTTIKQFLYAQVIKMEDASYLQECQQALLDEAEEEGEDSERPAAREPKISVEAKPRLLRDGEEVAVDPVDVIKAYRSLTLNNFKPPNWLESRYRKFEAVHSTQPVIPLNRPEKLVFQKYSLLHPAESERGESNVLLDGFRMDIAFPAIKLNIEIDGPSHK